MSIDRLDSLLAQVRLPDPDDDGFTEIVMQGVRAPKPARPSRRRFVTRPAVLAAAAVLVTGGALAAAVRTTTTLTNEAKSTAQPSTLRPTPTLLPSGSPSTNERTAVELPGHTAGAHTSAAPRIVRTYHNANFLWGYTTSHTSFVLDKRTGLKVVTDTRSVSLAAGRSHEVIVSVINTSSTPMGISSQNGCAVSAAAWHGAAPDVSMSPAGGRDLAKAGAWTCADGTDARSGGSGEQFLLAPGGVRSETVSLRLSRGNWSIAAVCRCDVVTAVDTGSGMTLHRLDGIVTASGGASGLVSPPVGVESR